MQASGLVLLDDPVLWRRATRLLRSCSLGDQRLKAALLHRLPQNENILQLAAPRSKDMLLAVAEALDEAGVTNTEIKAMLTERGGLGAGTFLHHAARASGAARLEAVLGFVVSLAEPVLPWQIWR